MVGSAALLLREKGVSGTSFAKVLEQSGAPRGSIGHHFRGGKREMVADAVRLAGDAASAAMHKAVDRGDTPAEVFSMMCRFYRRSLVDSGFAAACPVGAVAFEAYDDSQLAPVVQGVFEEWRSILADALVGVGRSSRDAADLAELSLAGLEGGLMLARVSGDAQPLDRVERQVASLLASD